MVNMRFEEKGLAFRITHQSYVDQGFDMIPTVHEGPQVRKMEKKGICTETGEMNRWIKAANNDYSISISSRYFPSNICKLHDRKRHSDVVS